MENLKIITDGFLEFEPGNKINCAVLKNGEKIIRVISQSGMFKSFHRTPHGAQRVSGLPSVVSANNVAKYISEDDKLKFIPYTYKIGDKTYSGYDATTITIICDAYLEAEKNQELTHNQEKTLQQAKLILRALAKVGISALIDEATGFQYEREYNALQQLLKVYIADDLMKWQQRFPRAYYKEIYRLYGWEFNPISTKHPKYIGKFTNNYVYDLFPEKVMVEIKSRNPVHTSENNTKYRRHKFHQYLTQNIGIPQLDQHVSKLIGIMKVSDNIIQFKRLYEKAFEEELALKTLQIEEN